MSDAAEADGRTPPGRAQRLLAAVCWLVAGAATGLAGVAVHSAWWGLALTAAATLAALRALPGTLSERGAFALGWLVLVGVALTGRPEGDYAVASNPVGYGLLLLALLVGVVGVVTVADARGPRRRPELPADPPNG